MKNNEILLFIGLAAIIVAIPFLLLLFSDAKLTFPGLSNDFLDEEKDTNKNDDDNEGEDTQQFYWGVDSASYTDENLFQCVMENFGKPEVWGRYLEDREGISFGLDTAEIDYLHQHDIRILVIYNHVNDARGFENGTEHAEQAIQFAENAGVPEGVAIFGDIEPDYPVDYAFINGWYNTLTNSEYAPGIYGVFNEGSELTLAFEALDTSIQENTIVWTAYPQHEITTQENAPAFNPEGPAAAPVLGWQYAIEAQSCTIDTNLFSRDMMDYLW
ncbi:glycoside hydrolase domain-containing protein [Oceanobacillus alkalisoli]|uniref:glycoside hydrolase domain-containing protein n=1 Tax=Oceanobacillus alkalisoli TaxID=2925113 RepID=UPI001EEFF80C|nr:glycoside hydrolase domain-containing protein [Oceanobacillus alkalisoli]MCF3944303.1 DUF1906 domain-containing protein [Oceanobacillus alkalisoli]MCG5104902.1 DUF1906 domain-containing protein [Oceanobacillus alkalisoli]